MYVVDLGTDTLNIYRFDETTGQFHSNGNQLQTKPGSGPRHIIFHSNYPFAFVCNELDSTISIYRVDASIGKLEHLQTLSTRRQQDIQS